MAGIMRGVNSYRLDRRVRVAISDGTLGTVTAVFEPGVVAPASEQQELALDHLVGLGLATIEPPAPPAPRRPPPRARSTAPRARGKEAAT